MARFDMTRFNPASMARKFQALGFSAAGAQQLTASQMLSDAKDRRRLLLVLTGLFESGAVQVTPGQAAMHTQSGIVIELGDDSA